MRPVTVPAAAESARPLNGATIIVTRAAARAEQLIEPLQALGANVLTYAATRIVARDAEALRVAACALARYDWVLFTSVTSVAMTFDATEACGITSDDWAHTRVATVGSSTAAAVRERGVEPALVPERYLAEGLVEAFATRGDASGTTMLYPAASGARHDLSTGLRALGATVDRIDVYESVATDEDAAEVRAALRDGRVHAVTMTASSAVEAWVAAMGALYNAADVVSIGPITTQAAHAAGMRVAAEAMPSTLEGLVAAVVRAVRAQRERHHHLTTNS
jgi:uroporphyrinogen-III synthase